MPKFIEEILEMLDPEIPEFSDEEIDLIIPYAYIPENIVTMWRRTKHGN